MVFNKLSSQVKGKAEELVAAGEEKIDAIIDEFNKMMPFAEELGLSVASFDIEAGLLPQIKTSLVGSIENIKDETVERLIS